MQNRATKVNEVKGKIQILPIGSINVSLKIQNTT